MLTRVENAFRSMKSSLGLRPNFHQNEQRADAHMFISVLAYHILHAIEYRLGQCGDHRLWSGPQRGFIDASATYDRIQCQRTRQGATSPLEALQRC